MLPDDGQHEWLDAGDAQVVTGVLTLILQDVLHDEDDILYELSVGFYHDHLL